MSGGDGRGGVSPSVTDVGEDARELFVSIVSAWRHGALIDFSFDLDRSHDSTELHADNGRGVVSDDPLGACKGWVDSSHAFAIGAVAGEAVAAVDFFSSVECGLIDSFGCGVRHGVVLEVRVRFKRGDCCFKGGDIQVVFLIRGVSSFGGVFGIRLWGEGRRGGGLLG